MVLQAATPKQVSQQINANNIAANGSENKEVTISQLAAHIRRAWERNRNHKNSTGITKRLLAAKRQRMNEYDPEILAEIRATGGSEIFMPLTATKCRAASSWITDILMPATDKAWGIESTPVPELPESFIQAIEKQAFLELQAKSQQGEQVTPAMAEDRIDELKAIVNEEINERLKKANEGMEDLIEDQLVEGGYNDALMAFIEDFVSMPTAILKGPIPVKTPTLKWGQGFQPIKTTEIGHQFKRVSPFDVYPSPSADSANEGDFIEHVRYYPSELYSMIGNKGYNKKAIESVLREGRLGALNGWMLSETERYQLENKSTLYKEEIDALHYWGQAQGLMLLEWGVPEESIDDPLAYFDIDAILIGRHVVRAVINRDPLARRPYYTSSFEKVSGSFWGLCPPELMSGIQRMCNAAARALANNMGLSSGPQVDVNVDRLADGETIGDIRPFRVWQTVSDPNGSSTTDPAIKFFQAQSNANELLAVYERFERMADDATNIPRYAYGNERIGGAGQTAAGLSMLMESANKGIKAAIRNIDRDVIRKIIEQVWFYNMLYHPDPSIKADIKVVARGASVLIAKDNAQARRTELLAATNNPTDMSIIGIDGRSTMLREVFKAADMPESIIPSIEKIKQSMAAQAQQPNIEMAKIDQKAQEVAQDNEQRERDSVRRSETDIAVARMRYEENEDNDSPEEEANESYNQEMGGYQ